MPNDLFTQNLRCVVERVTFQNPENGWAVIKGKAKGYAELVTLVGAMADVPEGCVLSCKGRWKVNAKYGQQFEVETWQESLPATVYGMEKYLGSGLIKGVGPVYASKIVRAFGAETLEVIEKDIERLLEVPGIGKKRVAQIAKSWETQKGIKDVMVFLQSYGVSAAYAAKIYREYGKESIEKVTANPYRLAEDIWGIGFATADRIAQKMGYGKEDPRRLRSGILYTLNRLADEGHCFATFPQLLETASKLLEADELPIIETAQGMAEHGDLVREETGAGQDDAIYLPCFHKSECGVARLLRNLADEPMAAADPSALPPAEDGMEYDTVQKEGILTALSSKVMVLTGGPGTGKTTTTKGIIQAYRSMRMNVLLAAPTGRAAKRMSEATGIEAKTIHRLLEYNPKDGFQRNYDKPLEGDALIVDECSMIDLVLMYNLLKAVPWKMRLILVGDIDQLPSVGAGNVLRDIIASDAVPVVMLTRIFRQALSSRIVTNAHAVNKGLMPDCSNGRDTDFFFINVPPNESDRLPDIITGLVRDRLPKAYGLDSGQIQVLTPMLKGVAGAGNLNETLQKALNPAGDALYRAGCAYRRGDKVMQIKNDYDKGVFNGDIGTIAFVDVSEKTLVIDFDGKGVCYDATELDEVKLAYACTIHKSQGSEFPAVVIPMTMKHYVMLQRNLVYTGITRAKKLCVLVGEKRALAYAVGNNVVVERNTRLAARLAGDALADDKSAES